MSIDKELVRQKLELLKKYIRQVEEMDFEMEEFVEDEDIHDLVTFRLQQAVEISLDMGMHIISRLGLVFVDQNRQVFEALAGEKIISAKTKEEMSEAAGFRNLVVHQYADLDFRQLFHDYKQDTDSLKKFAGEILEFIKK